MRLHTLKIEGFRRIENIKLEFGETTFLIGQNNLGKSSILKVIEILLSARKQLGSEDYHSIVDEETGETKPSTNTIIIEAEFRNLPDEANSWRGFKGRIFNYETEDETGFSVTYKKTYVLGQDVKIEFKSKVREVAEIFTNCKTGQDYIDAGLDAEIVSSLFDDLEKNLGKSKPILEKLDSLDEIWEIGDEETWFQNPGGIPGNVLKMLPRFLLIPIDTALTEIQGNSNGVLNKTLSELFETVREKSDNFKLAQEYLDALAEELDPTDEDSEFGKMMIELNTVLTNVFPDSKLYASTDLSNPSKVLKPTFNVEMSSNVRTAVENQGSGIIRATVFGMLRYRQQWLSKREDDHNRALIICFEEPEIYLHPSAANQMREAIYELSGPYAQIIASTHSPYLIDISRKPKQVLNRLALSGTTINSMPFSVSDAFLALQEEDKQYVKMLLKIDDYMARAFFTNHVVIVEGDTEDILIRESLLRVPKSSRLKIISNFEILKARGKASIIGLVKYLISMRINPIVVYDRDEGIEGAVKFNKPIEDALNGKGKLILMKENVEDEIGYIATHEKPFKAFQQAEGWGDSWEDIPESWRKKMKEIFGDYID